MKRPSRVHCLFEQSGVFKREFIRLGIPAYDYDISNEFGETDFDVDLFDHIELAYKGRSSLFDRIVQDDLIFAFFPCIEFSSQSQLWYLLSTGRVHGWSDSMSIDYMIQKNKSRSLMFDLLLKLCGICLVRGFRLIVENPYTADSYLKHNFLKPPSLVHFDRSQKGDFRVKATAYWFFNCEPLRSSSFLRVPRDKVLKHSQLPSSGERGSCSIPRSLISPEYARLFIADHILGSPSHFYQQLDLFDL